VFEEAEIASMIRPLFHQLPVSAWRFTAAAGWEDRASNGSANCRKRRAVAGRIRNRNRLTRCDGTNRQVSPLLAMQKVVGSSPIIRSSKGPGMGLFLGECSQLFSTLAMMSPNGA
jgi:hypothetical protein